MMTDAQRPIEAAALGRPSVAPAWKTKASLYVVATADKVIPPDGRRFMAQRAGARVTEAAGSHAVMVPKPSPVAKLIMKAARSRNWSQDESRSQSSPGRLRNSGQRNTR